MGERVLISISMVLFIFAIILVIVLVEGKRNNNQGPVTSRIQAKLSSISYRDSAYSSSEYPLFTTKDRSRYTMEIDSGSLAARSLTIGDTVQMNLNSSGHILTIVDETSTNKIQLCAVSSDCDY